MSRTVRSGSTPAPERPIRRWRAAAGDAAAAVVARPAWWLAGALAWLTTVGWIPFAAALLRPPGTAELTYVGTRFWASGLWPLNLVAVALSLLAAAVLLLAAAALGNAVLLRGAEGRQPMARDVRTLLAVSVIGALPVALGLLALLVALLAVGPAEFNRPVADPAPAVRVAVRLAPLLAFTAAVAIVGSTMAGLAGRAAIRRGRLLDGLADVAGSARRAGAAGLLHLGASVGAGLTYLVVAGLLLRVLWAPIGAGLDGRGGIDLAAGALLVGFAAIWLCLVLAGGALHAWASVTATRLLDRRSALEPGRTQETPIDP